MWHTPAIYTLHGQFKHSLVDVMYSVGRRLMQSCDTRCLQDDNTVLDIAKEYRRDKKLYKLLVNALEQIGHQQTVRERNMQH